MSWSYWEILPRVVIFRLIISDVFSFTRFLSWLVGTFIVTFSCAHTFIVLTMRFLPLSFQPKGGPARLPSFSQPSSSLTHPSPDGHAFSFPIQFFFDTLPFSLFISHHKVWPVLPEVCSILQFPFVIDLFFSSFLTFACRVLSLFSS